MDVRSKLDREFHGQSGRHFADDKAAMEKYIAIAAGYVELENVMAVLSNLDRNESVVIHGRFSETVDVDIDRYSCCIPSIWEEGIFSCIHPDDLEMKLLHELLFFHYIHRLPVGRRFSRCLLQRLRMRGRDGEWMEVLHRLHYIPGNDGKNPWLALCLYGAMTMQFSGTSAVLDTITGQTFALDGAMSGKILSKQEITVLKLIDGGRRSREIADDLNISVHTVSRHRQNIIAKLKVRNSAEACNVARNLSII